MRERRFLFVAGCPRSGTTMLTTLLNWSNDVFVAQERYAPLVRRNPGALLPSLFEPARLHDFRPRECGYDSFASKREYSNLLANPKDFGSLGAYRVVGDKITHLFRRFDLLEAPEWSSEDVTIVHAVRNVYAVVASYLARKKDVRDNWDWGEEDAVRDWHDAVRHAHAFQLDGTRASKLFLIDYDWMVGGDEQRFVDCAERLFRTLRLSFGERERDGARGLVRSYRMVPKKPPLPVEVHQRVEDAIDGDTLAKYEELRSWSIR